MQQANHRQHLLSKFQANTHCFVSVFLWGAGGLGLEYTQLLDIHSVPELCWQPHTQSLLTSPVLVTQSSGWGSHVLLMSSPWDYISLGILGVSWLCHNPLMGPPCSCFILPLNEHILFMFAWRTILVHISSRSLPIISPNLGPNSFISTASHICQSPWLLWSYLLLSFLIVAGES